MLTRAEFANRNRRKVATNLIRVCSESADELECYLNALDLPMLGKMIDLMYLGRDGSGNTYKAVEAQELNCRSTKQDAIMKLMEKRGRLAGYLSNGLCRHDQTSL